MFIFVRKKGRIKEEVSEIQHDIEYIFVFLQQIKKRYSLVSNVCLLLKKNN